MSTTHLRIGPDYNLLQNLLYYLQNRPPVQERARRPNFVDMHFQNVLYYLLQFTTSLEPNLLPPVQERDGDPNFC